MYYIGIDVGGMSIKAGIIDENGNILRQQFIVTVPDKPSDEIVEQIAVLIEDIAKEHKLTMADIAGIGLGFPGSVWDQKGEIVYCCNINLVKVPVVKMLTARLGVKNIKISNDANCAALAETRYGASQN